MISVRLDEKIENELNFIAQQNHILKSKVIKDALVFYSDIRIMMEKYIDILMDLADISLMFIANKEDIKEKI